MKNIILCVLSFLVLTYSPFTSAQSNQLSTKVKPSPPETKVVERGPHHRVVESIVNITNGNGKVFARTNTYTELATGMHYESPSGKWLDTEAKIKVLPN